MRKVLFFLFICAYSIFTRVYAEPFEVPGNPKHPAFMDDQKSIELKYRSHILGVFNSVTCGADREGLPEKVLKALEEYPEEVNDVIIQDGFAITVLMAGIRMNDPKVVQSMLDKGAIPFTYRGRDVIDEVLFIDPILEIKPEIVDMIRKEQEKYNLYSIIIKSKS